MSTGNSQKNGTAAGQNLLALPEGVELGQYRIIRKLGQGGFGITYLAEVIGSGEQVVIKENLPTFCAMRDRTTLQVAATDPDDELQEYAGYLERFVNEARLLAQLNHPNIVKVLGAFEALGTAYYVMPWVGGRELQTAAPASGVITESWLLPILRTLLSTLEYLHGRNIYHRDVKPANILLTEDGIPVLIDFGTARAIISDRSATHVGSPGYSPIEQITADAKRGPWTDVYSLGATCYRLITGNRPPESIARIAAEEDPLLPLAPRAELRGRFSPEFLATIDKALALRGKNRWQTAAEWLAVLPVPAPQPAPPTTPDIHTTPIAVAPEPARRTRFKVSFILVSTLLVLVLALGIPGGYIFYQHSQATAQQLRDELARVEAERKAKEEAERKAREEAERKAREETERKAREEAERKAREEAERMAREEAERKAREEAERKAREEAKRKAREEAERKAREEAERKAREEAERKVREEAERKAREEAERKAREEAERKAREEADRKAREEAKRLLSRKGISESEYSSRIISAAEKGNNELLSLLITAGADVYAADEEGCTPLHRAACWGHSECVKLLLAAPGIDVNLADEDGWTPLYWAAHKGCTECVKLLLAAPGIDVNAADKAGWTPLDRTASNGHSECVKLLLAAPGIDVNKADEAGWTPLYWAATWGRSECVKLLLAAPGIDVNKANKNGWTPLKAAERKGHSECARLIRAAGGKE